MDEFGNDYENNKDDKSEDYLCRISVQRTEINDIVTAAARCEE